MTAYQAATQIHRSALISVYGSISAAAAQLQVSYPVLLKVLSSVHAPSRGKELEVARRLGLVSRSADAELFRAGSSMFANAVDRRCSKELTRLSRLVELGVDKGSIRLVLFASLVDDMTSRLSGEPRGRLSETKDLILARALAIDLVTARRLQISCPVAFQAVSAAKFLGAAAWLRKVIADLPTDSEVDAAYRDGPKGGAS